MWRRSWPSGGSGLGGLTMSEDGGLEEVEESFRAAASCCLETCDSGLERLQPRLLGIQQRLQAPTIRARLPCLGFHGWLCYIPDRAYATPVNGYRRRGVTPLMNQYGYM